MCWFRKIPFEDAFVGAGQGEGISLFREAQFALGLHPLRDVRAGGNDTQQCPGGVAIMQHARVQSSEFLLPQDAGVELDASRARASACSSNAATRFRSSGWRREGVEHALAPGRNWPCASHPH